MIKLDWDIAEPQEIGSGTYIDGGEILSVIAPEPGYFAWATASIDVFGDIVIYSNGLTEQETKINLLENIKKFTEMLNG